MLPLGGGLLLVGGFAVWMMTVTNVIPRKFPWKRYGWRKEDDPDGWKRYLIGYSIMAGAGGLMVLVSLIMGW